MRTKNEVDRRTWQIGLLSANSVALVHMLVFGPMPFPFEYFAYIDSMQDWPSFGHSIAVVLSFLPILILPGLTALISWDQRFRWGAIPIATFVSWDCCGFVSLALKSHITFTHIDSFMIILVNFLLMFGFDVVIYSIGWAISHGVIFFISKRYTQWQSVRHSYHYFGLPLRKKDDPTIWPPPPSKP